jgi:hypothetical protein
MYYRITEELDVYSRFAGEFGRGRLVSLKNAPGNTMTQKVASLMSEGDTLTNQYDEDFIFQGGRLVCTYRPTGRRQTTGIVPRIPRHTGGIAYTAPFLTDRGFAGLCLPTSAELRRFDE